MEGETISVCLVAEEDIERRVYVNIVAAPSGKTDVSNLVVNKYFVQFTLGELNLDAMLTVTGKKQCTDVTAPIDGDIEPNSLVYLQLQVDDTAINEKAKTTIKIYDYNS